ncbi:HAD family hydrolase [Aerococcus kribbianus]|uniref:HAD hydrolase-like protein n=1 Tax=Aerococcus kribbianus TaxID=2999064 RepID=A0A9X3FMG5_9LACT|nr:MULTISPECIES: HAD hydrolase-like protein [unclassified Aerococcus]MCZ0717252.1 HAD hydrolase-like protein [Aerococcus sp. YH-aer221]MCZ0725540.1 HAD hydrolase-like protein [Aerococcus sp. YH-aer222]
MSKTINEFTKENDLLICVDSDGCAMDTMNVKHYEFFGPIAAEVFGIQNKEAFQEDWNHVNLFSTTRGVNRFTALVICLQNAQAAGEELIDITALAEWADTTDSLSNGALEAYIEAGNDDDSLQKALDWSYRVNKGIHEELTGRDKPFPGAKEGLAQAQETGDVAIVSSANGEALDSEWNRHGLMTYVDVVCGQEVGPKQVAIAKLLEAGYDKDNVLMVGDAPGDLKAAQNNGVHYYPIMPDDEKASWERFKNEALAKFQAGEYGGDYEDGLIQAYNDLLANF